MYFTTILFIVIFCVMGIEATRCNRACTREYNPVCGILKRSDGKRIQCTFGNACQLNVRRCIAREQWLGKRGRCAVNSAECQHILRSH